MAESFTIGVVTGVSADKWIRVWRERMPDVPLSVLAVEEGAALEALADSADMVFARLPVPSDDDELSVIPLWSETPMVVAAKDHPVKVFDTVTVADLADEELYDGWDDATLDIVAAGHGVARMPQSVFRATGRRDVVAREITDAEPTRVGLVWRTSGPLIDEFIGIVRGRTANSSRGAAPEPDEGPPLRAAKAAAPRAAAKKPTPPQKRYPRTSGRTQQKRGGTRGKRR
ncbi:LysR family transcriptional regulator substrate-binding protein [Naasia aerilata]|uniref:LysR family transcriptional regulator n=1 Tax=Naasia aerilata TaxID=1162966 RepID=A0ABN6XRD5_9MICO|nr:LysR family transcriptional regulator substrate-binding protein [Naasia aerilata]BDZ47436.1 LysR family transcriptional regulator [Naasia aerilata]